MSELETEVKPILGPMLQDLSIQLDLEDQKKIARWAFKTAKPIKSIHIYQDDETLKVDLEFEDKSMLEMIFRVGFRSNHQSARKPLRRLPHPQENQAEA